MTAKNRKLLFIALGVGAAYWFLTRNQSQGGFSTGSGNLPVDVTGDVFGTIPGNTDALLNNTMNTINTNMPYVPFNPYA